MITSSGLCSSIEPSEFAPSVMTPTLAYRRECCPGLSHHRFKASLLDSFP